MLDVDRDRDVKAPSVGSYGALAGLLLGNPLLVLALVILGVGFLVGLVVLSMAAYAGAVALVASAFLLLLGRQFRGARPSWLEAYRAAFVGFLCALTIDGLRRWISSRAGGAPFLVSNVPEPETIRQLFTLPVLRPLLGWLWPAIPITAIVLAVARPMYRGIVGFSRAMVVSAVSLPASLITPLAFLIVLERRLAAMGPADEYWLILLGMMVSLGVFALLGGVFAGPVLYFSSHSPDLVPLRSALRAYLTAAAVLFVCAGVTCVVMFFVPLFDPYADHLLQMADAPEPLTYLLARPSIVPAALVTLGLLQLPGILLGARLVRSRFGPAGHTGLGDRGALFVALAAVVASWPLVAVLAWLLVRSGSA